MCMVVFAHEPHRVLIKYRLARLAAEVVDLAYVL